MIDANASSTILRQAHAVLLPAYASLDISAEADAFLAAGGKALLLGESRAEYVARGMSDERTRSETAESFRSLLEPLREKHGQFIVAIDQELAGIQRLHKLVPALPNLATATKMPTEAIVDIAFQVATAARAFGITMFLSPILDLVTGENAWLTNRTLGKDASEVARIGAAFIRGVQKAGIAACAKHFPGYASLSADPALTDVQMTAPASEVWAKASPFHAAIEANVAGIMPGPAAFAAIDPQNAACLSPAIISVLRNEFRFKGLIVSDDLDAPATMGARTLAGAAVAALSAGAELLLIAGGPHLGDLAAEIARAVADGKLPAAKLSDAAKKVADVAAGHF